MTASVPTPSPSLSSAGLFQVYVHGTGAVSPAGWNVPALIQALEKTVPLPLEDLPRPGWNHPLKFRPVPSLTERPAFLRHPRLRRTSPITQYAVSAALEAARPDLDAIQQGGIRLGVALCTMSGCVTYSRRFYDETLREPATASPLVFPETVFNAPASHLAAVLGSAAIDYTLVGDIGSFFQGLALAGHWFAQDIVDACLVVGAEEMDWLTADAFRLFSRGIRLSAGAGAIYLKPQSPRADAIRLQAVTDPWIFLNRGQRQEACSRVRAELLESGPAALLCDSRQGVRHLDEVERLVWKGWTGSRISPKTILGEGLTAASAWQCIAAVEKLRGLPGQSALVSLVGCNQQAVGARFGRADSPAGSGPPPAND
jgi:hypothetical protein